MRRRYAAAAAAAAPGAERADGTPASEAAAAAETPSPRAGSQAGSQAGSGGAAARASWDVARYEAAIAQLYGEHNPEKVDTVPSLLAKYQGHEEELLVRIKEKYGIPDE
jgi:hypothetical protein